MHTRTMCTTTALISFLFKDAGGSSRATARCVTAVDITHYLHNITIVKTYAHAHDALQRHSPRSRIYIHIHIYIYIYMFVYAHAHDALQQLSPGTHIHICIHTYIYTCWYMHTHTTHGGSLQSLLLTIYTRLLL